MPVRTVVCAPTLVPTTLKDSLPGLRLPTRTPRDVGVRKGNVILSLDACPEPEVVRLASVIPVTVKRSPGFAQRSVRSARVRLAGTVTACALAWPPAVNASVNVGVAAPAPPALPVQAAPSMLRIANVPW